MLLTQKLMPVICESSLSSSKTKHQHTKVWDDQPSGAGDSHIMYDRYMAPNTPELGESAAVSLPDGSEWRCWTEAATDWRLVSHEKVPSTPQLIRGANVTMCSCQMQKIVGI